MKYYLSFTEKRFWRRMFNWLFRMKSRRYTYDFDVDLSKCKALKEYTDKDAGLEASKTLAVLEENGFPW